MKAFLLGTNVVSVLFTRNHPLRDICIEAVVDSHLAVSFMTRAELLLWPAANNWGKQRRADLVVHAGRYATLYPDDQTCAVWAQVVDRCRRLGRPIQTADAWIAAAAIQWSLPLVTADYRDFASIDDLEIVPIRSGSESA